MSPRVNVLLAVFFLIIFASSSFRLASLDRAFYREEVRIGAMPAWLWLPVPPPVGRFGPPDPPSPRPPVVIVQHGFSASRQAMSWLARGLVRNGFAVLAADFRGHGHNPTPFNTGELSDDITHLIEYAATRPEVDATRVALVGHSMGAAAVYAYGLRHEGISAVVPLSGSSPGGDLAHPSNVLLIYASGDPERTRAASRAAMGRLTGVPPELAPTTVGDPSLGNGRRLVEVTGHDHVTILFSETPVRETVDWLRATWRLPAAAFQADPPGVLREGLIGMLCGLLLFFPLSGFIAGAVLRTRALPGTPQPRGVSMAFAAVLAAGVVLFAGTPLGFLPYVAGDELLSFFLVAGSIYAVWLWRTRIPQVVSWSEHCRAAAVGVVAFGLVYATVGAGASRLFFNLMLSGQRFAWFLVAALALLPLGIGLETALRPPGGVASVLRSLAAKLCLIVGLIVAISFFGTLPPVVGLMIPSFLIVLPVIEAVAARLYVVSGSPLASGVLTALLLAWIPAAIFPIGY